MANETMSLMEFLRELLTNAGLQRDFADNPDQTLAQYHLNDLSPEDVRDALVLAQDNDTADFSRHTDSGADVQWAAPHEVPAHHGGDHHKAAVDYLRTYVTNNVDDRDTNVDNSVNQHVDTHGGDFDQDIDTRSNVVSGDHAVGAGDDIDGSTITTGDDNQVGDGNVRGDGNVIGDDNHVVGGDGNTTAFGAGDANSASFDNTTVDDGGALSVGGRADGYNTSIDSHDQITRTTDTDVRDDHSFSYDSQETSDSYNDEKSSVENDSHEHTTQHVDSDNSFESHTG